MRRFVGWTIALVCGGVMACGGPFWPARSVQAQDAEKAAAIAWLKKIDKESRSSVLVRGDDDEISERTLAKVYSISFGTPSSLATDIGKLRLLKYATGLETIDFQGSAYTDDLVPYLSALKNVRRIDFRGTGIKDKGLEALSKLPNLQNSMTGMRLQGSDLSEAALCSLARLTKIATLFVETSTLTITERGVRCLGRMTALDLLVIEQAAVYDDAFKALPPLPKLTSLTLTGTTGIGPGALEAFSRMGKLESLSLRGTGAGVGLGALARTPVLKHLSLGQESFMWPKGGKWHEDKAAPLGDADAVAVRSLKNLESLSIDYTRITDATVRAIGTLRKLTFLSLAANRVSGKALAGLSKVETLETLVLYGTGANDDTIDKVAGLPNLKRLDLRYTKITDVSLILLRIAKRLRLVRMEGNKLSEAVLADFCRRFRERTRIFVDGACF